ncbi:hypothetical protein BDR07DRAFT_1396928 [Suillus spraguei]|nr:hypothetical protein BDR07DRAFT_1396928 [Suillus spraguei]
MNALHYPEPTWMRIPGRKTPLYTRPLLGSELFDDRASVLLDGMTDACVGFTFESLYAANEVKQRVRNAFAKLRFSCPIIAANIVGDISGPIPRSWVYAPVQNLSELTRWMNDAFCTVQQDLDVNTFVEDTSQRRLPYQHQNASPLWFRCYLLLGNNNNMASIFMARMPSWTNLPWGMEWHNLPLGPVSATGGPREDWNIVGTELLKQLPNSEAVRTIPLASRPFRMSHSAVGKTCRLERILDPALTRRLVNNTRIVGCSMSRLFEAAYCMVLLARNQLPPSVWNAYHFEGNSSAISLIPHLKLPYDTKTHFISSRTHIPIQISLAEISPISRPESSSCKSPKPYSKDIPYTLPERSDIESSVNNVGPIERQLPLSWKGSHSAESVIELESVLFSVRLTSLAPIIHIWTMKGSLHVQVQANDVWPIEDLQDLLDAICSRACLVLEDLSQNAVGHPSDAPLNERSRL